MSKKHLVIVFLCALPVFHTYAQHSVSDVGKYNGWYQLRIDLERSGGIAYHVTQCYPGGEVYEVTGAEKDKLPLSLKVLCMAMVEEGMKGGLDLESMTFEEDGFFLQMNAFSFTMVVKISKTEDEILESLGAEAVNKYRNRRW
jgi:hypothetical protein